MIVSPQNLPACEAKRPSCETCADGGRIVNWVPVWNQADENGGWMDTKADGWIPCPDCQPQAQKETAPGWTPKAA